MPLWLLLDIELFFTVLYKANYASLIPLVSSFKWTPIPDACGYATTISYTPRYPFCCISLTFQSKLQGYKQLLLWERALAAMPLFAPKKYRVSQIVCLLYRMYCVYNLLYEDPKF